MRRWYLKNPRFIRYMLRELTAVFLAAYALGLLAGLVALVRGPDAWASFVSFLGSPVSLVLHGVIGLAALYNTVTWFQVSPKAAPPIVVGGKRVPDRVMIGGQYVLFAVLSVVLVLWARNP